MRAREKPKSTYQYPGGNVGGPISFGDSYTKNKDRLFFFVAYEAQRQQVDSGSHFTRTYSEAMRNGDFSELLANRASNLNSIPQLRIPQGFPNAGANAPNNDMRPYMTATGRYFASLYPQPNYNDPANLYNYVYSKLEPTNRHDFKGRFDWTISNSTRAYVRIANEGETVESSRGVWWAPADVVALPTPNIGENKGRSYAGNVVSVLSPTMTNEVLVSYSRLTLDNHYQDPNLLKQGAGGITFRGIFPAAVSSPYLPTDMLHGWGGSGQVGNLWAKANDMFAHNDALQFSNKLTKLAGAHGLKFGLSVERGQKQQNFENHEAGEALVRHRQQHRNRQLGRGHARRTRRAIHPGHGQKRRPGARPACRQVAVLELRRLRAGQLEAPVEPDARVWRPLRVLDEQQGAERPRRLLHADLYNPNAGSFLDPGTYQRLNGVCYVYTGCAPDGILDDRSPFALPRVNVAWDIDGEGNNVLRGGYGMFFNRNMGNVEYDNTLRLPPNSYQVATDFWAGGGYGGGVGLTYDTISEATLANRIGSIGIHTLTPDSFVWPKTHSYSLSYARRIPWNQVVEAAYVGTRGRDLVSQSNGNVMPYGVDGPGTFNGVDLSVPVNRVAVASDNANLASFRPYNALNGIRSTTSEASRTTTRCR